MKTTGLKYGIFLMALFFVGCDERDNQKITTKQEHEFSEIHPATQNINGNWSAEWRDPVAGFSEKFTMTLEQKDNELMGSAEFDDQWKTKAVGSGHISGDEVLLVMKPDSEYLHEVSWKGTVSEGMISGTWFLHGKPPKGMASSGPWSGFLEKEN